MNPPKRTARLDWEAVDVIRSCQASATELANRFGVAVGTVHAVRAGLTWKQRPLPLPTAADLESLPKRPLDPRCRRLTWEHALRIRELWVQGYSSAAIARSFNTSTVTVWHITRGKTWKVPATTED
jgi:uncharacterized protein YjcR